MPFATAADATRLAHQEDLANDPTNKSTQLCIRMVSDEHGPKPGGGLPGGS